MAKVSRQQLRDFALSNPERYLEAFGDNDPLGLASELRDALTPRETAAAEDTGPTFGERVGGGALALAQGTMRAVKVVPDVVQMVAPNRVTGAVSDFLQEGVDSAQELKPESIQAELQNQIIGQDENGETTFNAPNATQVIDVLSGSAPQIPFMLAGGGILSGARAVKALGQGGAKALGLGEKTAEAISTGIGMGATNSLMVTPDAYDSTRREALDMGMSEEDARSAGLKTAGMVAPLSFATGGLGLGAAAALGKGSSVLGGVAKGFAVDAPFEAFEEGGQALATDAGLGRDLNFTGAANNAALGLVAGGLPGAVMGGIEARGDALTQTLQRATTARAEAEQLRVQQAEEQARALEEQTRAETDGAAFLPGLEPGALPAPPAETADDETPGAFLPGLETGPITALPDLGSKPASIQQLADDAQGLAEANNFTVQGGLLTQAKSVQDKPQSLKGLADQAAQKNKPAFLPEFQPPKVEDAPTLPAAKPAGLRELSDTAAQIAGSTPQLDDKGMLVSDALDPVTPPKAEKPQTIADLRAALGQPPTGPTVEPSKPQRFKMGESLNIPRAEMPQIKAGDRSSLVQYLRARGVENAQETVDPNTLKPTQAEYFPDKVAKAREFVGEDTAILVSSDNRIIDGHHQWLAKKEAGVPMRVIRLGKPAAELLPQVREFPSATFEDASSTGNVAAAPEVAQSSNVGPAPTGQAASTGTPEVRDAAAAPAQAGSGGGSEEAVARVRRVLDLVADNAKKRRPSVVKAASRPRNMTGLEEAVSTLFKRKVSYFETDLKDAPNGFVDPDDDTTVYINTRADKPHQRVVMHELLHSLKNTNEASYRALSQAAKQSLAADAKQKWNERYGEQDGAIDDDVILEEILADAMGDYGTTKAFWQKLSDRMEPSQFQRVVKAFSEILQKVMDALGKNTDMGSKQYFNDLKAVQKALLEFADQNRVASKPEAKAEPAEVALSRKERTGKNTPQHDDKVIQAYLKLTDDDAAFQLPTSRELDLPSIVAEVISKPGEKPVEVIVEDPDPRNKNVMAVWEIRRFPVIQKDGVKGERVSRAYVNQTWDGEVYIDISDNAEGSGGSDVYAAVANYAYNNGLVFKEDPAGLTPASMYRRTENMLSSALKFGTTKHLAPGPFLKRSLRRADGTTTALEWGKDDTKNFRSLLELSVGNMLAAVPELRSIVYNGLDNTFENTDGSLVSDQRFNDLAASSAARSAKAGGATLKRAVVGASLLREVDPGRLDELLGLARDNGGPGVPRGIAYSRRSQPLPVGRDVKTAVDAEADLDAAFRFAASQTFGTNRAFKVALQQRIRTFARGLNRDLSEETDANDQYLARMVERDATIALRDNANAVGWYDEKVSKARAVLALIHPEIETDPDARFAFTWVLAATSNGLKVDKNFELAERAYRAYRETGKMPTDIGIGTASKAINDAMRLFNAMAAKMSLGEFAEMMTTKAPAKDIEKLTGYKVSGESPDAEVYGAAIIGPKIGNGFFANLYGHFEQLTMDRWLMRTWGRWTGTLIERNQEQINAKRELLPALIRKLDAEQRAELGRIIGKRIGEKASNADEIAAAITKASQKEANRDRMADIRPLGDAAELDDLLGGTKKGQQRESVGDEIRKAGNALTKYLDGQKEAPGGTVERRRIRRVFNRGLAALQKQHPGLTMSDLQALLWYPEKRLYDAAGAVEDDADEGYSDDEAPDYANAAVKLAQQKGVDRATIDAAQKEVDRARNSGERGSGAAQRGSGVARADAAPRPAEGVRLSRRESGGGDGRPEGGADQARASAPDDGEGRALPGYSVSQKVGSAWGSDPALVAVAEQYAADNGIPLRRQAEYVNERTFNEQRAARVAQAYEAMEHAPSDPRVKAAYADLIRQTRAQYDALVAAGYKFWLFGSDSDPYNGNPWSAMRDLRDTRSMAVYASTDGFGTNEEFDAADNPLLADTGLEWPFGSPDGEPRRVLANDLFRAVHDAFGHGLEGAGFRWDGEENAWQAHVRLFTGDAVGAITSETRGQNSWLNWGPHGETNRNAKLGETIFADQKTGLMPEWTWTEGRIGDMPRQARLSRKAVTPDAQAAAVRAQYEGTEQWLKAPNGKRTKLSENEWVQVRTPNFKKWFGDWESFAGREGGVWNDDSKSVSKVVDENGEPLVVYHGSKSAGFNHFDPETNRKGDFGTFFTSNKDTAMTYSGSRAEPEITQVTDDFDEDYQSSRGVYPVFLNIRNPQEDYFEGANWDGTRYSQFTVLNEDGEMIYTDDGRGYFESQDEAQKLADQHEGSEVHAADDHHTTTDGVVREARQNGNDGAIIRQVVDDGPDGYGAGDSDVFVIFDSTQVKSATQNTGAFNPKKKDIRLSRKAQTQTPEFKRWFGDSKVVDAGGEPLLVYHGSTAKGIEVFDTTRITDRSAQGDEPGTYFTSDGMSASNYTRKRGEAGRGELVQAYLKIERPLFTAPLIKKYRKSGMSFGDAKRKALESLDRDVHDGIIFAGDSANAPEYVVFKPGQIKSATDNNGDFNPADERIRYSRAAVGPRDAPLFAGTPAMELGEENLRERMTRLFVNNMNRVDKAREYLASKGATLTDDNDVATAETLYYGKTGEQLRQLDQAHIKPLMELVKRAENMGLSVKDVDDYLIALHAEERNRQVAKVTPGVTDGSGMTDAEAKRIKASYGGPRLAALTAISQKIQAMNADRVKVLRDYGLTDPETLKIWTQTYQNYVPLKTVDEEPDALGTGMGYDIRGNESKRALGRGSRATSPLLVSILDSQRTIIRAQKAEVGRSILKLAEEDAGQDLFEIRDQDSFRTLVYNSATGKSQEALDTGAMRDAFAVKVGGQVKFVVVKDEVLKHQIQKIGSSEVGPVVGLIGKGTRILSKLYTQYNPGFTLVNAVRDAITAGINAKAYDRVSTAAVLGKLPKAWKAIAAVNFGKGSADWKQLYEEFLEDGASSGGFGLDTIKDLRLKAEREFSLAVGQSGLSRKKKAWHATVRGFDALGSMVSNVNEVVENASRLSLYAEARAKGYNRQQAARMAKEITVNFNRKGEWGSQINSIFMFFNAAIQGNRALYLHMQKSPKVKAAVFGIGAVAFALAALNDSLEDDEETGDEVENKVADWELDHSAVLFTDSSGERIKFPLPYGYNVAFVAGRRAYRFLAGKDSAQKTAIGIVGAFYDAFMPLGGAAQDATMAQAAVRTMLPTIGTPFFDVAVNRDQFGKPISKEPMSRYAANTPESQQYFKGVSPWAKGVTEWLNSATGGNTAKSGAIDINPEYLDFWLKFGTGGVGSTAIGVGQLLGDDPSINRAPIIKAFYGAEPEYYLSSRMNQIRKTTDVLEGRMRDGDDTLTPEELRVARASRLVSLSTNRLYKRLKAAEAGGRDTTELEAKIERQQRRLIRAYNEAGINQ